MRVTTFAVCEQGSRSHNDDSHGDADLLAGRCVVVADGAGGHRGGALASQLVTDTVLLNLANARQWNEATLIGALDAASRAVHRKQDESRVLEEMSSTVVLLCLDPDAKTARWTHLGDSRLYHFRRGVVEQLTHDHSLLQTLLDAGLGLTEGTRPDRSVLYAAIGTEGDTRPVVGMKAGLEDGDAFLLCTDGVWDVVSTHELERLFVFAGSVREWVESISAAVGETHRPAQDNHTALGVWIGEPEEITVIKA